MGNQQRLRMQILEERLQNMSKANAYLREQLLNCQDELRVITLMLMELDRERTQPAPL